uniref:Cilia and flagella associated protein 68 n=1 Tax=Paramormyrops kingsleyae TaxID=1676925 RepID=A0A3B3SAG5_9TELE
QAMKTGVSCHQFHVKTPLACHLFNHHQSQHTREVWRDLGEDDKFGQYGWRCSTSEDAYSNCTLTGNWCEERFDIRRLVQRRPLPSQLTPSQELRRFYTLKSTLVQYILQLD